MPLWLEAEALSGITLARDISRRYKARRIIHSDTISLLIYRREYNGECEDRTEGRGLAPAAPSSTRASQFHASPLRHAPPVLLSYTSHNNGLRRIDCRLHGFQLDRMVLLPLPVAIREGQAPGRHRCTCIRPCRVPESHLRLSKQQLSAP